MLLDPAHTQGAFPMKTIVTLIAFIFTLTAFAGSGSKAITIVLDQPEVEQLENEMQKQGYTLSKIEDVFAARGVYPRCPCTSLNLTFSRPNGGKAETKVFNAYAKGFGTSLDVSIQPEKK